MIIVGPRARETADKLANRCRARCYDMDDLPSTLRGEFVINYGGRYPNAHLNPHILTNKVNQIKALSELGRSPKIWLRLSDVPDSAFPILARRKFSSRGRKMALLRRRSDRENINFEVQFYEQFIPKKREFRVHVLGNKTVVTEKIKVNPYDNHFVFGHSEGYRQAQYNGTAKERLAEIAKQAVKVLDYDFGAVDILLGEEDNKFYILEVNSGPCLLKWMRIIYAQYFKDMEREWKEQQHRW